MTNQVETKLSAACTRLILDRPFLGALVLRMPMKPADPKWCTTIGTDARHLYYNPDYIDSLSLDQTQFALAHEALHCALSHFARREHRNENRWDIACDLAINPILIKEGMTAVPGALYNIGYEGMMAEEIYPLVKENSEEQTHDQHLYGKQNKAGQQQLQNDKDSQPDEQDSDSQENAGGDNGDEDDERAAIEPDKAGQQQLQNDKDSQPDEQDSDSQENAGGDNGDEDDERAAIEPGSLSDAEKTRLSVQWRQRMAGAAQQAMQAGKLTGSLRKLVDHLLQPQLPWRMLLARYITASSRDDYSYMRPSRREGSAIFPSLRGAQIDIVVVLDTSGSIKPAEMQEFVTEIDAIKGQVRARITLHACDAALSREGPWVFEPWEGFELPGNIGGGGGTRFTPVFDHLDAQGDSPDLLVYFTDADGEFPKLEPRFPVIWLVKGQGKIPWGQRIQLN